jgi:hypothetical protein
MSKEGLIMKEKKILAVGGITLTDYLPVNEGRRFEIDLDGHDSGAVLRAKVTGIRKTFK